MNEYQLKQQICEIGRRLYNKGFAAANDGNSFLLSIGSHAMRSRNPRESTFNFSQRVSRTRSVSTS